MKTKRQAVDTDKGDEDEDNEIEDGDEEEDEEDEDVVSKKVKYKRLFRSAVDRVKDKISLSRNKPKVRSRVAKLSPLEHRLDSASSSGSDTAQDKINLSKFCHECGNKHPLTTAKFCVECGIRRLPCDDKLCNK